ncbi:MAG: methyltransferase domain-containing protein [Actinobacteria bacterium]|nr:methyltransferase domain-containing protein [Actinomycetota bacterium]
MDLRRANRLFHDYESVAYDQKWGIIYDSDSSLRVTRKFEKVLGFPFPHVERMLDVGCGTGYASLNICMRDGLVEELHACDISDGMVDVFLDNASALGIRAQARRSEMEQLDYPDNFFDMVVGHAVLHHVPDLRKAISEINRVLVPGGICILAGEPTRAGDKLGRIARELSRILVSMLKVPGVKLGGKAVKLRRNEAEKSEPVPGQEYENVVDVHTFDPEKICELARSEGFCEVRFEAEELLSSFVGWITRTVQNMLSEENVTDGFRLWSYHTYLSLSALDEILYRYVPSSWFYNMLLFARKAK